MQQKKVYRRMDMKKKKKLGNLGKNLQGSELPGKNCSN